jgi:hypothetical protein
MLRDLDQRHVARPEDAAPARPPFEATLKQGTRTVAAQRTGRSHSRTVRRIGLAAAVCAVLLAAVWYALQQRAPVVDAGPEPVAAIALPPTLPLAPHASEAPPSVQVSAPVLTNTPVLVTAPESQPAVRSAPLVTQPEVSRPAALARGTTNAGPTPVVSLRMEPMLSTHALTASVAETKAPSPSALIPKPASITPTPVTVAAPTMQRQQQASADALAQAQTLWNAGSQAAAIDLMQQTVDAAERAVKAGSSPVGNPVLLSQVRELTRMQMALGRYGPVWETLSSLEPVLGNAPDLWGLRGNTAQRLGRHADSVRAYTAALQSRPNEQRWMLGAAVSMAALGQTDQAAAMAEKAHDVGEISREVQTYLHQMGVPLKAR